MEIQDGMARITRNSRAEARRKFEAIVQLCYEAIGARPDNPDFEPERAIKAFRSQQKAEAARLAAMIAAMPDDPPPE